MQMRGRKSIQTVGLFSTLLLCATSILSVRAQTSQASPVSATDTDVSKALEDLRRGDVGPWDIEQIAKNSAKQAIPDLEKQFDVAPDKLLKGKIAGALVRLGDVNPKYWNFLTQGALDAIASDIPLQTVVAQSREGAPEPPAPLAAWAKAHNMSIDAALQLAMIDLPYKISFLGLSNDARAVPLLRQALTSQDVFVVVFAADGLAAMNDKASIASIVDACRRLPPNAASAVASSLEAWNDPTAKKAAKSFRTGSQAK